MLETSKFYKNKNNKGKGAKKKNKRHSSSSNFSYYLGVFLILGLSATLILYLTTGISPLSLLNQRPLPVFPPPNPPETLDLPSLTAQWKLRITKHHSLNYSENSIVNDRPAYTQKLITHVSGNDLRCTALRNMLTASKNLRYTAPCGTVVTPVFSNLKTDSFTDLAPNLKFKKRFPETNVYVIQLDSFEAAELFQQKTKKVAVLNMANASSAGSSVFSGDTPQEQELCRRSDLVLGIKNAQDNCKAYDLEHGEDHIRRFKGLYTHDVNVLLDIDYSFLEVPFVVDVLTVAAPRTSVEADLRTGHELRARAMYQVAAVKKVDVLIMSAFGCGVFDNKPEIVSEAMGSVLKAEFQGVFESVVFAIVRNTKKPHVPYLFQRNLEREFPRKANPELAAELLQRITSKRNALVFGQDKFIKTKAEFYTEQITSLQVLTDPNIPSSHACYPLIDLHLSAAPSWAAVKECAGTHGIVLTD